MIQNLNITEGQPSTYYHTDREAQIRTNADNAAACIGHIATSLKRFGLPVNDADIQTIISGNDGLSTFVNFHFEIYIEKKGFVTSEEIDSLRIPFSKLVNFQLDAKREMLRYVGEVRGLTFGWNQDETQIVPFGLEQYISDKCTTLIDERALNRILFAQTVADEAGSGWWVPDYLQKDDRNQYSVNVEKILLTESN